MNKKSLALIFLLCTSQSQALWEIPAAFLMGMAAKTSIGQKISSRAFLRCKGVWLSRKPIVKIENPSIIGLTMQSAASKGFVFLSSIASQGQKALHSTILAFKARAQNVQLKNPLVHTVQESKINHAEVDWISHEQPYVRHEAEKATQEVHNFIKVDSKVLNQSTSGLFPRTTNNYYSGASEQVIAENGKAQFWKGMAIGGFTMGSTMTWLHSKQEQKK